MTKQFLIISAIAGSLLLSACVGTLDDKAKTIRIISNEQASMCVHKGSVYSEAPYYGVFTEVTKDKLIELAKNSAARLDANSVVLDNPMRDGGKYTMKGNAFGCAQ